MTNGNPAIFWVSAIWATLKISSNAAWTRSIARFTTHYARRGIAFTGKGRIDFRKRTVLRDKDPIDRTCECLVCQKYRRNYIAHLIRANEVTGGSLITFHNLFFFNTYVEKVRAKIKKGCYSYTRYWSEYIASESIIRL